jgi:hypothetical protein|tara:strand:+ start:84 stop:278 length:195 start_codon:yes stop_codon:yes gene_type:complete
MWAAHGQHEVKSSLHRPLELRKVKIAVKLEKFQGVADKGTRGGVGGMSLWAWVASFIKGWSVLL